MASLAQEFPADEGHLTSFARATPIFAGIGLVALAHVVFAYELGPGRALIRGLLVLAGQLLASWIALATFQRAKLAWTPLASAAAALLGPLAALLGATLTALLTATVARRHSNPLFTFLRAMAACVPLALCFALLWGFAR